MSFLAPSLLLGLLAAALPWLVHLIGRRRAVPVRFAAMELLLRSERRVAARRRIRELLLLLARTAIAAALPLVFARPFTEQPSDLPQESLGSQSAVLLLDDSASMQRVRGGATLFERARDQTRTLLRQLPKDSELALLLASRGSEPRVGELTGERARMLDKLEGTSVSARVADFTQALRRAALILSSARRQERRIFVVTDLQGAGWAEDPPWPNGAGPEVVLLDVAKGLPPENRAIVGLLAEPAAEAGPGGLTISAEVASFAGKAPTQVGVTLKVDGAVISKGMLELPSEGRATKRFLHTVAGSGGVHDIEVSIDEDAFPLDDRRTTRISLAQALRVLIINGDARTALRDDEAFFLEQALRAGDRTATVTSVLPDDASSERLAQASVVFLANVGAPSAELAAVLARYVEGGGGLFLSVGSRVDAERWNERLGKILPQPLSAFSRTAAALPGQGQGETLDNRPAERLAPLDRRHPLLAHFSAEGEGLSNARFFKYVLLEPVPDTHGATVVLRFANGAPALVERQVGKGRVLLLATTIDRDWTDLPIQPGFLPLVHEAARRLSGTVDGAGPRSLLVGDARTFAFGGDERRIEVTKPDGNVWVATRERGSPTESVAFTETDLPGFYRVRVAGSDGLLVPRAHDGFAVNVDPAESNPALVPAERRPDAQPRKAKAGPAPKRRVELWHGLAGLLLVIVMLESLLTVKWRRPALAGR